MMAGSRSWRGAGGVSDVVGSEEVEEELVMPQRRRDSIVWVGEGEVGSKREGGRREFCGGSADATRREDARIDADASDALL